MLRGPDRRRAERAIDALAAVDIGSDSVPTDDPHLKELSEYWRGVVLRGVRIKRRKKRNADALAEAEAERKRAEAKRAEEERHIAGVGGAGAGWQP